MTSWAISTQTFLPMRVRRSQQPSLRYGQTNADVVVRYLDTSALAKLVRPEADTNSLRRWLTDKRWIVRTCTAPSSAGRHRGQVDALWPGRSGSSRRATCYGPMQPCSSRRVGFDR